MEAWSATERVFTRLRSLSPLTTLLGRAFAAGYADGKRLKGEEAGLTFFMVMFAGYATRTLFLDSIGQPLLDRTHRHSTVWWAASSTIRTPTGTSRLSSSCATPYFIWPCLTSEA